MNESMRLIRYPLIRSGPSCIHHLESISLAVRGSSKDLSRVMNPRGKYPHG